MRRENANADSVFSREGRHSHHRRLGFRLTLSRSPKERERQILAALVAKQRSALAKDVSEAKSLVQETLVSGADVAEQAAWVQAARVLLNLDEFITRE